MPMLPDIHLTVLLPLTTGQWQFNTPIVLEKLHPCPDVLKLGDGEDLKQMPFSSYGLKTKFSSRMGLDFLFLGTSVQI